MATRTSDGSARAEFAPTPVLRPRQQVESQIREAILSGQFAQGDRLPSETRLAERFGVSRATVREALQSLVEGGLITKVPGATGGSFVEFVDHHKLSQLVSDRMSSILDLGSIRHDEVAAFRDLLEIPCARLAALNRTDDDLVALREVIEREKATTVDDPSVPHLNAEFHSLVAQASQNRVMAAFVSALHRVAHPLAFINTDAEVGKQAVRHHIKLCAAIQEHDVDAATELMRKHLDYMNAHARERG
ncbi:FadR/GntR family transcriptional regulator [Amycolatopsis sp. Poz14]|uniref:FadR/GntR family transcriptional regulator n=1 Tax=Amycolatopsis sp. Poz14 TaxID=1447705 RepID=UPI001EE799DD|nr:FadR/GntR family transcriptional regulator [Amycolatopsis sp. Poz14]MCG3753955.1 FadR family transcriptional regulator [Amycolatopsis sp. Poz14]